jgi:hypothetical protein
MCLLEDMGFLGFGKRRDVIDLGDVYRRQKEKSEQLAAKQSSTPQSQEAFDFLGQMASTASQSDSSGEVIDVSAGDDKKKRLAKRIMDMTTRLEDISNQIYHLQQRIEVLERKMNVNQF